MSFFHFRCSTSTFGNRWKWLARFHFTYFFFGAKHAKYVTQWTDSRNQCNFSITKNMHFPRRGGWVSPIKSKQMQREWARTINERKNSWMNGLLAARTTDNCVRRCIAGLRIISTKVSRKSERANNKHWMRWLFRQCSTVLLIFLGDCIRDFGMILIETQSQPLTNRLLAFEESTNIDSIECRSKCGFDFRWWHLIRVPRSHRLIQWKIERTQTRNKSQKMWWLVDEMSELHKNQSKIEETIESTGHEESKE